MKKILISLLAIAVFPVIAMAQGCPSSEPVTATVTLQYTLEHMLEGEFSVSGSTKVNFSQGNLQYKASAAGTKADPNWRFAENQWDYIGSAAGNTTAAANRSTQSDWIDLFGWATSGNPASNCEGYQPWYVGTENTHYGPGVITNSTEWKKENSDWGYVNAVQLGLGWRVLSAQEWLYLMRTRTASTVNGTANARFALAYLFGTHHGIILFPDEYTHPDGVALPTEINTNSGWNANTYSAEDWEKMEKAGCVFLPAAGYRNNVTVSNANAQGNYWTSTISSNSSAYSMYFVSSYTYPGVQSNCNNGSRSYGYSVRLVKNHQ